LRLIRVSRGSCNSDHSAPHTEARVTYGIVLAGGQVVVAELELGADAAVAWKTALCAAG